MAINGSSQDSRQPRQDHHVAAEAPDVEIRRTRTAHQDHNIAEDLEDSRSKFSSTASQSAITPLIATFPRSKGCTSSEFKKSVQNDRTKHAIEILPFQTGPPPAKKKTNLTRHQSHVIHQPLEASAKPEPQISTSQGIPQIPDRIRINSFQILGFLAKFDREIDPGRPIVMKSPFKFMVHYEKQIRESVEVVERQIDEGIKSRSSTNKTEDISEYSVFDGDFDDYVAQNGVEYLKHLRCLIELIDEHLLPTIIHFNNNKTAKVSFRDLWFIFEPGQNVYMPIKYSGRTVSLVETLKLPETLRGRYNRMWRVVGVGEGRNTLPAAMRPNSGTKTDSFSVGLYHIDFDGRFYIPITHTFEILPFEGEKDIKSLDFYPVRFTEAFQSKAKGYFESGKRVFDCMRESFTHFYYAGPTLMTQPCGCLFPQDEVHQQYIESEVIVDFRTALLQHQAWRPDPAKCRIPQRLEPELEERSVVTYFTGTLRGQGQSLEQDQVYDDYYIDMNEEMAFRDREQIFAPISSSWICNESSMPEQDTDLLPPRVFAFVLRTRTFAPLLLWALRPIEAQTNALRTLQLKDDTLKDTVEALVRTHFLKEETESTLDVDYDSLRSRGKGLVILLHGAPGVGKTFTAESLASANGKPLFQISCGDLGLSPKEVEKSLRDIFRYAQMWKCVLLLDECDVFLAQRGKDDIKRNALVCVFLRVLEFYTGILFLTTNRVGVIDDAVRSRITWMAYYPPLNENQTKEIWKTNLDHLKQRNSKLDIDRKGILSFAQEHFIKSQHNNMNWDGRQIQNAFQVAVSLAEWEHFSEKTKHDAAAKLSPDEAQSRFSVGPEHFRRTAAGVEETDQYLREATGFTGAERAFNALERADDFREKEEDGSDLLRTPSLQESPRERRLSATLSPKKRDSYSYKAGDTQMYVSRAGVSQITMPRTNIRGGFGGGGGGGGRYARDASPLNSPPSRKSSMSVAIHQQTDEWTGQTHRRHGPHDPSQQWHESEQDEDDNTSDEGDWDDE